ncbi:unnamed protein product [Vitrella brassicaformis CCMP3155]|uniref:Uncharacterized protein n=2 Tax=Vitrella brassicaformis TaxID=1169539 RepID=A0A0G4H5Y8_VITBC|nr:unnamed protein product [Vitrella brassicaformis CCMP3155]|eukprot:CEM38997.1 unnamed protein product [Vitrella brassicaformis CCMP3155]
MIPRQDAAHDEPLVMEIPEPAPARDQDARSDSMSAEGPPPLRRFHVEVGGLCSRSDESSGEGVESLQRLRQEVLPQLPFSAAQKAFLLAKDDKPFATLGGGLQVELFSLVVGEVKRRSVREHHPHLLIDTARAMMIACNAIRDRLTPPHKRGQRRKGGGGASRDDQKGVTDSLAADKADSRLLESAVGGLACVALAVTDRPSDVRLKKLGVLMGLMCQLRRLVGARVSLIEPWQRLVPILHSRLTDGCGDVALHLSGISCLLFAMVDFNAPVMMPHGREEEDDTCEPMHDAAIQLPRMDMAVIKLLETALYADFQELMARQEADGSVVPFFELASCAMSFARLGWEFPRPQYDALFFRLLQVSVTNSPPKRKGGVVLGDAFANDVDVSGECDIMGEDIAKLLMAGSRLKWLFRRPEILSAVQALLPALKAAIDRREVKPGSIIAALGALSHAEVCDDELFDLSCRRLLPHVAHFRDGAMANLLTALSKWKDMKDDRSRRERAETTEEGYYGDDDQQHEHQQDQWVESTEFHLRRILDRCRWRLNNGDLQPSTFHPSSVARLCGALIKFRLLTSEFLRLLVQKIQRDVRTDQCSLVTMTTLVLKLSQLGSQDVRLADEAAHALMAIKKRLLTGPGDVPPFRDLLPDVTPMMAANLLTAWSRMRIWDPPFVRALLPYTGIIPRPVAAPPQEQASPEGPLTSLGVVALLMALKKVDFLDPYVYVAIAFEHLQQETPVLPYRSCCNVLSVYLTYPWALLPPSCLPAMRRLVGGLLRHTRRHVAATPVHVCSGERGVAYGPAQLATAMVALRFPPAQTVEREKTRGGSPCFGDFTVGALRSMVAISHWCKGRMTTGAHEECRDVLSSETHVLVHETVAKFTNLHLGQPRLLREVSVSGLPYVIDSLICPRYTE